MQSYPKFEFLRHYGNCIDMEKKFNILEKHQWKK